MKNKETFQGLWHYLATITEPVMENSAHPKSFADFMGGFLGVFMILLLGLPFYVAMLLLCVMGKIGGVIAIFSLPFTLYVWFFKEFQMNFTPVELQEMKSYE